MKPNPITWEPARSVITEDACIDAKERVAMTRSAIPFLAVLWLVAMVTPACNNNIPSSPIYDQLGGNGSGGSANGGAGDGGDLGSSGFGGSAGTSGSGSVGGPGGSAGAGGFGGNGGNPSAGGSHGTGGSSASGGHCGGTAVAALVALAAGRAEVAVRLGPGEARSRPAATPAVVAALAPAVPRAPAVQAVRGAAPAGEMRGSARRSAAAMPPPR